MYLRGEFGIKLDQYAKIFQSLHKTDHPLPSCNPITHLQVIPSQFSPILSSIISSTIDRGEQGMEQYINQVQPLHLPLQWRREGSPSHYGIENVVQKQRPPSSPKYIQNYHRSRQ